MKSTYSSQFLKEQQKNRPLAGRVLTAIALSSVGLFAGFDDIYTVTIGARNGNSDHLDLFLAVAIQPPNSIVKYEIETLPKFLQYVLDRALPG